MVLAGRSQSCTHDWCFSGLKCAGWTGPMSSPSMTGFWWYESTLVAIAMLPSIVAIRCSQIHWHLVVARGRSPGHTWTVAFSRCELTSSSRQICLSFYFPATCPQSPCCYRAASLLSQKGVAFQTIPCRIGLEGSGRDRLVSTAFLESFVVTE